MSGRATIGIGVIGLGHWGPNHVRVFSHVRGAEVVARPTPPRIGGVISKICTVGSLSSPIRWRS
jgi:hypothetical protein